MRTKMDVRGTAYGPHKEQVHQLCERLFENANMAQASQDMLGLVRDIGEERYITALEQLLHETVGKPLIAACSLLLYSHPTSKEAAVAIGKLHAELHSE